MDGGEGVAGGKGVDGGEGRQSSVLRDVELYKIYFSATSSSLPT